MSTDFQTEIKSKEEYLSTADLTFTPSILKIRKVNKSPMDGVEKVTFKRLDVEKDNITAENMTTGQTEVAHIKVGEAKKTFNKYVAGAQISQSYRNGEANKLGEVHSKVLRQYFKMWDKMGFDGANGNNGVFNTSDEMAIKNASEAISGADNEAKLNSLIGVISAMKEQVSDSTASNDVLLYVYGKDLKKFMDQRLPNLGSVRSIVAETWPAAEFQEVSVLSKNSTGNVLVAISQGLVTLNYVSMPDLGDQGTDNRSKEYWADYSMGALMVDVEEKGALIEQPLTFA